jgi:hypothetical protein
LEWLYQSDFDLVTTVALWSIAGVLVTTLVLFLYTLGLRAATVVRAHGRTRFIHDWRIIFARAMMSDDDALNAPLPRIRRSDRTDLLEEWNSARSIVEGSAADNMITLARRAGVTELASRLLKKRRVRPQILAAQTFGNLRDADRYDDLRSLVDSSNTALSITAVMALVQIDADKGISVLVPMIEKRRDWPKNRVSIALREAGSERISEPMYRAIRSAKNADKAYLLQFAQLVESEVLDALIDDLIRENNDPAVLNAALKLVRGYRGVPRIASLTQHDTWYVRMQTAKVLGRMGQKEHLSLLESLLDDREWWVRYRAAQAIASLPFLGPNQLRQLPEKQTDRYAADILRQAIAEVGLA